jgi:site-specific recombinase XerD
MDGATIKQTIEKFAALPGHSAGTEDTYRKTLRRLLGYLPQIGLGGDSPVADLDLEQLVGFAAWLNGASLSRNTLSLTYNVVLGYVKFLIEENHLPGDLYAAYMRLRTRLSAAARQEKGQLALKLPDQEIVDALVEAARTPPSIPDKASDTTRQRLTLAWRRDLAIVLALQSSGVRVGELVDLRRKHLDASSRSARVVGKGDKERLVAFSNEAWAAIRAYLEERRDGESGRPLGELPVFCRHDKRAGDRRLPLSTRSVQYIVHRLAEQAGIAERFHMTPHKLRHFFATRLLRETGDLAMTQDFLGHASPATTRIYAQPSKKDMLQAHDRAFRRRPPPPQQHTLPGLEEEEDLPS